MKSVYDLMRGVRDCRAERYLSRLRLIRHSGPARHWRRRVGGGIMRPGHRTGV